MNLQSVQGSLGDSLFLFYLELARLSWRLGLGITLKAHSLTLIPVLGRLKYIGASLLLFDLSV